MLEFVQVEVLVLKRVRQLVREHQLLHLRGNPVGNQHGLAPRVVDARCLLREKGDEEFLQVKVARHQAEGFEHRLLLADFARRVFLLQVLGEVIPDLSAVEDLLLERRLDRQRGNLAHVIEDGIGGREQRLRLRLRRGSAAGLRSEGSRTPRNDGESRHANRAGEKQEPQAKDASLHHPPISLRDGGLTLC